METNAQKLYQAAFTTIGKDASPRNLVPNFVGCAESVSCVINQVTPFPEITGTTSLLQRLSTDPRFEEVAQPEQGAIIISATGTGSGIIPNGHTGIVGKNISPDGSLYIMSNSSASGIWSVDWTVNKWVQYYQMKGGFPIHYFRLL